MAISETYYNRTYLNSRGSANPSEGGNIMTSTKATGPLAVLESGFRVIPEKQTDFT
jgi:hypothetical protein